MTASLKPPKTPSTGTTQSGLKSTIFVGPRHLSSWALSFTRKKKKEGREGGRGERGGSERGEGSEENENVFHLLQKENCTGKCCGL